MSYVPKANHVPKHLFDVVEKIEPGCKAFTFDGAERLANKIRKYWMLRGYSVETKVFADRSNVLYAVRSSMVNGLPKAYKGGPLKVVQPNLVEVNSAKEAAAQGF